MVKVIEQNKKRRFPATNRKSGVYEIIIFLPGAAGYCDASVL
jgi:hypothetical protein